MAAEVWTLDGLALNDASSFVLLTVDAPPPPKKPEWIAGADADGEALLRDPLFSNRTISLRVRVMPQTTMDLALAKIGQVIDKLEEAERQPDGLALVWTPQGATKTVTFYVLSGEIDGLPISRTGDGNRWLMKAPILNVNLTCKPFGYGPEVTGSTATSSNPVVTVTQAGVTGDVPAEARLVVTDMASKARRHVEWGLEWRYYNAATSLIVDSDDMGLRGGAQVNAGAGYYDPNASGNNAIQVTLTEQPTAVCDTGSLAHVGVFRVKLRCVRESGTDVYVRFNWQEGDGPFQPNPWTLVPINNAFNEIDLGIISIPPKTLGTQRWLGIIEAYASAVGETFRVDALWLIPAGEGYGKARATTSQQPGTLVARDEFTSTTAGNNLNARSAPAGGTWATSGATTDFQFADAPDTAETITRATTSDASGGRYAILGSTSYTDVEVQAVVRSSRKTSPNPPNLGVIARWTDASNYAAAYLSYSSGTHAYSVFALDTVVAGVRTTLAYATPIVLTDAWYYVRLTIFASGRAIAYLADAAGAPIATVEAFSSVLATGGTLATGKPGVQDWYSGGLATTRYIDTFSVITPAAEPIVIHSGQSIEFRHDDPLREDSTGTYWGPPPSYRGSRFLLPPAGDENRTSRILAKGRRNDVDAAVDGDIADSTKVEVFYTPRYLAIPR